jgi:hypothetical protein
MALPTGRGILSFTTNITHQHHIITLHIFRSGGRGDLAGVQDIERMDGLARLEGHRWTGVGDCSLHCTGE